VYLEFDYLEAGDYQIMVEVDWTHPSERHFCASTYGETEVPITLQSVESQEFIDFLKNSIISWGMGKTRPELRVDSVSHEVFDVSLKEKEEKLTKLVSFSEGEWGYHWRIIDNSQAIYPYFEKGCFD
jgi:hypothetical protein